MSPDGRNRQATTTALAFVILLASILRYRFAASLNLSEHDPWRHLQLLRNLESGVGFSLFDGQPYIWYNPVWYRIVHRLGAFMCPELVSCGISVLSCVLFFFYLLRTERSTGAALLGGVMIAAFGPIISFTCTYGSESLALFLTLAALLLSTHSKRTATALLCGILFGVAVVSRFNFLFNGILILALLATHRKIIAFLSGVAIILLLVWIRNHAIIADHVYLFTWDGLATRCDEYHPLSILIPQLHPAVAKGTRALYESIAPTPFFLYHHGHIAWGTSLLVILGFLATAISRNRALILATLIPLIYFNFFDRTLSTNFFRHYLALFPLFFIGIVATVERLRRRVAGRHLLARLLPVLTVAAVLFSGAGYWTPLRMLPLRHATPPPSMVTGDRYMVNSGYYHPESLAYRWPEKKFIGMPLSPEEFDTFHSCYPEFTSILWHLQFSVQDELLKHLVESGRFHIIRAEQNGAGIRYLLLEETGRHESEGKP